VIDLTYSEVEEELRAGVRAMLARRCIPAAVRAGCESPEPFDAGLWRTLAAEMGCAGLPVPVELGGAGASWREAAVVAEELGRAVAPVPFLPSAVVASAALLAAADAELLPALAAGAKTAALVLPAATGPGRFSPTVTATHGRLTGDVSTVAGALAADVLLVPTFDALYAVERAAAQVTPVVSFDLTQRLADVSLRDAHGRVVAFGAVAHQALVAAHHAGTVLLACEQLGIAQWCLDSTVEYVKTRHQFGRPVGSFQAVKHRLADLWVDVTQARAAARYAAGCLAINDPDLAVAASLARACCAEVAVRAAEECVQLHGGIGFTWEHPAHLYLKRAKASAIVFGTPDRHRSTLAELIDIPA
jgi:alkylation response protein AidB-like acyl-CoA dehydrogenase